MTSAGHVMFYNLMTGAAEEEVVRHTSEGVGDFRTIARHAVEGRRDGADWPRHHRP